MSNEDLRALIDNLIAGELSRNEQATLQAELKASASSRQVFYQRMELEAGLRGWAAESVAGERDAPARKSIGKPTKDLGAKLAVAALILLAVGVAWWYANERRPAERIAAKTPTISEKKGRDQAHLGTIVEQSGNRWKVNPVSLGGAFVRGNLALEAGVAELRFHSGTNVILQAPCELNIIDGSNAELVVGSVAVNVTEQSNGFVLQTPESAIVDEGTEYAVSVSLDATEVHVFEGSVWWVPRESSASDIDEDQERIASGEAKRYSRSQPSKGQFVPFGERKFVRELEQRIQNESSGEIVAYDGFENLAGRLRRGRSGFGWENGWERTAQPKATLGEIIDAPNGSPFGSRRDGRWLLRVVGVCDMRRRLSDPIRLRQEGATYLSFLVRRNPSLRDTSGSDESLRLTLEPDLPGRGRKRYAIASFGFAADCSVFLNSRNRVSSAGLGVLSGEDYFCVLMIPSSNSESKPSLRLYHSSERISSEAPGVWTIRAVHSTNAEPIRFIRITSGPDADWLIDELRLGTSWQSVVGPRATDEFAAD
ncbi:MAG: FecR domain-containing protein [Planctomycetota bacterium]